MEEVKKLRRLLQRENAVEAIVETMSLGEWEDAKHLLYEVAKIADALYKLEYDGDLDEIVDLLISDVEYEED